MNKDQVQMLSVKNTIERVVQSYQAAYKTLGYGEEFLREVERFVAGLFASGQIDRDFFVVHAHDTLRIDFATQGNCSSVSFLGIVNPKIPTQTIKPHTSKRAVEMGSASVVECRKNDDLASSLRSIVTGGRFGAVTKDISFNFTHSDKDEDVVSHIRHEITKILQSSKGEPNNEKTRAHIAGAVSDLLRPMLHTKQLYDYTICCNEENNSPATIDRGQLVVDASIKVGEGTSYVHIPASTDCLITPHQTPEDAYDYAKKFFE